jgi:sterol desaturase/sphingolipid hydroxylase (fatty acid hydroxylase superfamily)
VRDQAITGLHSVLMPGSNLRTNDIPGWLSAASVGGTFTALLLLELRRPLRRPVESKLRRNARNLAVAGLAAATVQLIERPVVAPLARLVEERRWGLLKRFRLPVWIEALLGAVLLDYTLYLWHVLAHKVPLLWRFHQVHHVDLDLDASTALRFHFGELAFSVLSRAAQVLGIGVCPLTLSAWQTALLVEIMFHHSNVELPDRVERWLGCLIVTPRMHGIHHSMVEAETNSNWSSGLTLWDWLHGTLRLNVPQGQIRIGVPAYSDPRDVTLPKIVELPFTEQRPSWQWPDEGRLG